PMLKLDLVARSSFRQWVANQSAKQRLEHGGGIALGVEQVRGAQPIADQPDQHAMYGARGLKGTDTWVQLPAGLAVSQQAFANVDELLDEQVVAIFRFAQLFGEFAAMHENGQQAAFL